MNIFKWRAKGLRVKGLMEIQSKGKVATVPFYCSDQILSGRTFERLHRFGQSLHCACVATLQRKRSWRTTLLEAHLRCWPMHTITCKHVGHGWMGREFIGRERLEKTQATLCGYWDLNMKCPSRGSCLKTWSPANDSLEGCRTFRKWCLAGGKFHSRNTISCLLLILASPRWRGAPAVASCHCGASSHHSFLFTMYGIFKFNQTLNQNMPFFPLMLFAR